MLFDPPEGKRFRTSRTVSPEYTAHTGSFTDLNALVALVHNHKEMAT
jgi:hypothetical protein